MKKIKFTKLSKKPISIKHRASESVIIMNVEANEVSGDPAPIYKSGAKQ